MKMSDPHNRKSIFLFTGCAFGKLKMIVFLFVF